MHKILKFLIMILVTALVILLIVLGFGVYKFNFTNDDIRLDNNGTSSVNTDSQIEAYDATYNIDGQFVTLVNGIEI